MSRVSALPPQVSTSLTHQVVPQSARVLIFPHTELSSAPPLPLRLLKELTLKLNCPEQPMVALVLTPLSASTNNCQLVHIQLLLQLISPQEIWCLQELTSSPRQPMTPEQLTVAFMLTQLPSTQQPKSLPHGPLVFHLAVLPNQYSPSTQLSLCTIQAESLTLSTILPSLPRLQDSPFHSLEANSSKFNRLVSHRS